MGSHDFVLPNYGRSTLAEVLPSIAAHLTSRGEDVLALPHASRYVLFLLDGFGWHNLQASLRELDYLPELLGDSLKITAAVPSTTPISLTTLGTGLTPGDHGMIGYTFVEESTGKIIKPLDWPGFLNPLAFQPRPTVFEQLTESSVSSLGDAKYSSSGLTRASLRGADFVPTDGFNTSDWVQTVVKTALTGDSSLVYVYDRDLDHVGHSRGWESDEWLAALIRLDQRIEALREALPSDVILMITGDHGMLDVPRSRRIVVEDYPLLLKDVRHLAGEVRMRYLYTSKPVQVAERWRQELGDRAEVFTADEAIAANWFGDVSEVTRRRLGDVIVAARDNWMIGTERLSKELNLIGVHGSLTAQEMEIPLLIDLGW